MGIHECGLVLRTVETPGHHCWASRGGQPEEAAWPGQFQIVPHRPSVWIHVVPSPSTGAWSPDPSPGVFSLLPPSVLLVTLVGPSRLCVSLPSFALHVLSVWALCFCVFLPAPAPPLPSALSHAFCCPELPHPRPMSLLMHFSFLSHRLHFLPSFVPFTPSTNSFMLQKRKKKGGGIKTQKSPNTTNLECVAKCCVLLVASVCPCGLQPARPPYPSAVCPARLPALPFLPTTRSSVPGCLVMVSDV